MREETHLLVEGPSEGSHESPACDTRSNSSKHRSQPLCLIDGGDGGEESRGVGESACLDAGLDDIGGLSDDGGTESCHHSTGEQERWSQGVTLSCCTETQTLHNMM